jgi:plasmid stabilization system protein ParE
LVAAPDRLVQFPESGRMVPEFGRPNLRELILRPYRIVYRLQGDVLEIVTVFHAARMVPEIER